MLYPWSACAQGGQIEADIDALLSPPNVIREGPDIEIVIARMKASPSAYVEAISNRLVLPDQEDLLGYTAIWARGNNSALISILEIIGGNDAIELLRGFYYRTASDYEALHPQWRQLRNATPPSPKDVVRDYESATGAVWQLQSRLLWTLGILGDGGIFKDVLSRYDTTDDIMQQSLKGYVRLITGEFPPPEAAITFSGTWLMMGLPLQPPTSNYESIFDEFTQDQPPFAWSGQGYVSEEELQVGRGYWGWSESSGDQTVIGAVVDSLTLDLMADWNLISGPSCDFDITSIDDPGGIIALPGNQGIFGWDGSYYTATVFEPGNAYWILTTSSGQITLDCSAAPGKREQEAIAYRPEEHGFLSMRVRDAEGRSTALFIGGELPPDNRYTFALPPIPPPRAGGFDARFLSGTSLIEGNEGTVALQSNAYPVLIETAGTAQGSSLIVEELANGQVVATRTVGAGTSFEITNPTVNVLRVWIR